MLHLTSCRRIGKDRDPTQAEIVDLRYALEGVETIGWRSSKLMDVSFDRTEWGICIAALRIASELEPIGPACRFDPRRTLPNGAISTEGRHEAGLPAIRGSPFPWPYVAPSILTHDRTSGAGGQVGCRRRVC